MRIITKKPLLSLANLLATPSRDFKLLVKTEEGIFEHCIHQRRLRAHSIESDLKVEELFWQRADIQGPLITGGPVGRHGVP